MVKNLRTWAGESGRKISTFELPEGALIRVMTQRRPMGGLENEVMSYLWTSASPVTPGEAHRAIAPDLAYTTIMTVLTRLWDKGMLDRERLGRSYSYKPVRSESDHRAAEMQSILDCTTDRGAVLESFVVTLGKADISRLRRFIEKR